MLILSFWSNIWLLTEVEEERLGRSLAQPSGAPDRCLAGGENSVWFLTPASPWASLRRGVTWTSYKNRSGQDQTNRCWPLLDQFSSEKRVTIHIVNEGFAFNVTTGDHAATGVKVTPGSKLLTQRGEVMLSPWDLISTLGKLKCQTGMKFTFTLTTLSEMPSCGGLNVILETA